MRREYQASLLILVGLLAIRVAGTDLLLSYVKAAMGPALLLSGAVLVLLGGWAWVDALRGRGEEQAGPGVAWLLLVPVLVVGIAPPAALGSFAAAQAGQQATSAGPIIYPPLPPEDPVRVTLFEYINRAVWDAGRTLQGRTVELTGFVTPDPEGGWWLSRLSIACCAADAQASLIKVVDVEELPADTWVTVTGAWVAGGGLDDPAAIPRLRVTELQRVQPPQVPYE